MHNFSSCHNIRACVQIYELRPSATDPSVGRLEKLHAPCGRPPMGAPPSERVVHDNISRKQITRFTVLLLYIIIEIIIVGRGAYNTIEQEHRYIRFFMRGATRAHGISAPTAV